MSEHNGLVIFVAFLLTGPSLVLLLTGGLAIATTVMAAVRRAGDLIALLDRSAEKSMERPWLTTFWGFAILALLGAVSAALLGSGVLAPLGVLILLALFMVAGLGVGARALAIGRAITPTEDFGLVDIVRPIAVGLFLLAALSSVPFIGWATAIWCLCTGIGSVAATVAER